VLPDPLADVGEIQDVVINMATTFGGETIARDQVTVQADQYQVTVKVSNYQFTPITPIFALFGVESFPVTRQATFHLERRPPAT
jgi:hypothetical protein